MFPKPVCLFAVGLLLTLVVLAPSPCLGSFSMASMLRQVDESDLADRMTASLTSSGTTPNIKQIVIGRCWDFQRITGNDAAKPSSDVDCDVDAWPAFVEAFAHQDPCMTKNGAYDNFLNVMMVQLPQDSTLFWSGTKSLADTYSTLSNGKLFALESTFLGSTINDLEWCGAATGSEDGINYVSCPGYNDCPNQVKKIFWGSASTAFARQATGSVSVLLNGSDTRGGAFRSNSIFATLEFPNLNSDNVKTINIIVIHNLDGYVVDTCDSGTLLDLKEDIVDRNMTWTCQDDPELATLIQRTEQPQLNQYRLASGVSGIESYGYYVIALIVVGIQEINKMASVRPSNTLLY